MMYIIVSYVSPTDPIINIECDKKGNTKKFPTIEKASVYAITNCAWHWKVIQI